ncbi:MAG: 4a-hydroxytetrahydrobiopterin dehydratase [Pseudomonadota bacterium]
MQLRAKNCHVQRTALNAAEIAALLPAVPLWQLDGQYIVRSFDFKNYYETLAFVNALAYIVHGQDHHPVLTVTYNWCIVKFNTHSVNDGAGGLSENDFICATKLDALFYETGS